MAAHCRHSRTCHSVLRFRCRRSASPHALRHCGSHRRIGRGDHIFRLPSGRRRARCAHRRRLCPRHNRTWQLRVSRIHHDRRTRPLHLRPRSGAGMRPRHQQPPQTRQHRKPCRLGPRPRVAHKPMASRRLDMHAAQPPLLHRAAPVLARD